MNIKILGSGCSNCKKLEQSAREAVEKLNIEATVEKITDVKMYAKYGILRTPGLVINDKLVSAGKVLNADQIIQLIQSL